MRGGKQNLYIVHLRTLMIQISLYKNSALQEPSHLAQRSLMVQKLVFMDIIVSRQAARPDLRLCCSDMP